MTSSFTSMLIALTYIAARFARQDGFVDALHTLPAALGALPPSTVQGSNNLLNNRLMTWHFSHRARCTPSRPKLL